MRLTLVINPEAEARDWYDAQHPGLGMKFLDHVSEVFHRIRETPLLYAKAFEEFRLALVYRFPYAVVYRVDADQITIVAVYHTHRDPRVWKSRGLT